MKKQILQLALCATLTLLPLSGRATDFGTEKTVSTELNWNVNTLTTDEPTSSNYTGNTPYAYNSVYIRKANSAGSSSGSTKWSDGTDVSWTSILNFGAATESQDGITSSERTAGGNTSIRRCVAFNASVPGTCYALVRVEATTTKVSLYHKKNEVDDVTPPTTGTYHEIKYTALEQGAFYIAANGAFKVAAIRFVPAYSLTTTATDGGSIAVTGASEVATSGDIKYYSKGAELTLTADSADGYKFVSWSGVDSSIGATATVTMTENKAVTANFAKAIVTTKWTFDQYVDDYNMFGSSTNQDAKEFTEGLYLHTRDADAANYKVLKASAQIANEATNFSSQTKTYKKGETYPALTIRSGNRNSAAHATLAGQKVNADGISYQAPAAGTFYATFYASTATTFHTYKNSTTEKSETSFSDKEGKELSVVVASGDVIYICNYGTGMSYLLEAYFVPTSADAAKQTVTIPESGYTAFSSTHNYTLPTGLKAYIVNEVGTQAKLKEITYIIPACTGVLLKGEDEGNYTLNSAVSSSAVTTNYLIANIVAYTLPADDGGTNHNYTLYNGATTFFSPATGVEQPAGTAFLRTTVSALTLQIDASTVGMDEIEANSKAVKFIENGQLFIRREGKVFSITGARVK